MPQYKIGDIWREPVRGIKGACPDLALAELLSRTWASSLRILLRRADLRTANPLEVGALDPYDLAPAQDVSPRR